ncbi:MAG TPA: preprotein translocase subunit SecG [Candidatus Aminicenantes bacterium]|nr:preprotein translocase subunit SecG [Candidatus Aminicenantes bacterium]
MSALIIILHIVVCLILIFAVLLQSGKAADLAGAFGGGGSQTAFGGRGTATLLSKVTTASAIIFMLTSLGLWILSGREGSSVVGKEKAPAPPAAQTAAPAATTPGDKTAAAPPAAATEQKTEAKAEAEKPPAQAPVEKK